MRPGSLKFTGALILMVALCTVALGQSSSSNLRPSGTSQSENTATLDTHHIQLLLLDGNSGKPVNGVHVLLRSEGQNGRANWPQSMRTNSDGIAEFSLVEPLPEKVEVSFETNEFLSCSTAEVVTDQILKSGAVAKPMCGPGKVYASHPPLAGQLVVYGRRITVWHRIGQAVPFLQLFSE